MYNRLKLLCSFNNNFRHIVVYQKNITEQNVGLYAYEMKKLFFSEFKYEYKKAFIHSYKKFILYEAKFASHLHTTYLTDCRKIDIYPGMTA